MIFRRRTQQFQPYYPISYSPKAKIDWSSILSNAQKTIGIINQAIPIFYQIGPIYRNTRTMLKVLTEFNKVNSPQSNNVKSQSNTPNNSINNNNVVNDNTPNFYI